MWWPGDATQIVASKVPGLFPVTTSSTDEPPPLPTKVAQRTAPPTAVGAGGLDDEPPPLPSRNAFRSPSARVEFEQDQFGLCSVRWLKQSDSRFGVTSSFLNASPSRLWTPRSRTCNYRQGSGSTVSSLGEVIIVGFCMIALPLGVGIGGLLLGLDRLPVASGTQSSRYYRRGACLLHHLSPKPPVLTQPPRL